MARWIELGSQPGTDIRTFVLMTDGTVLAKPRERGDVWVRLTPDGSGSYARGTWGRLPPMRTPRLGVLTRAVTLTSGRLFVWGGNADLADPPHAEIYDAVSGEWSDVTPTTIDRNVIASSGPTTVLPGGQVLVGSHVGASGRPVRSRTAVYDPATSRWSTAGFSGGEWERTWTSLADGSILNVFGPSGERFVPATGGWSPLGRPPFGSLSPAGPALRLPDGRVWMLFPFPWESSRGHGLIAYYSPVSGVWTAGPDLPDHVYHGGFSLVVSSHSTACLLPDSRIFFQGRRHATPVFAAAPEPGELRFYEFDPESGSYFEQVPPAALTAPDPPAGTAYDYFAATLLLPDGTVLVSRNGATFIYDPEPAGRGPRDDWRPVVHHIDGSRTSVSLRPGRVYTVYGELFAGLSEANSQPEGALATNYPLVRITYDSGAVAYWRTYDHSSRAVGARGVLQTFRFAVPSRALLGRARLEVVTNAIASAGIDAHVETANRFWLWQAAYREGDLLIGNLADGGYIIVRPGGIQPVGPWDPVMLTQLDEAARNLQSHALQASTDWKRVGELPLGVHVTVADAEGQLYEGALVRRDDDALTIEMRGQTVAVKRDQVMELFISAGGVLAKNLGLTDGAQIGSDALVYRNPASDFKPRSK